MRIHHIGFVSKDISKTVRAFQEILGAELASKPFLDKVQRVNEVNVKIGDTLIQVFEPVAEPSPVNQFLTRRGEGLHHLCFEVENIQAALDEFRARGAEVIWNPFDAFEDYQAAFLGPMEAGGLLIELVAKKK
jgi:methylmalonyl-CoA epimerase